MFLPLAVASMFRQYIVVVKQVVEFGQRFRLFFGSCYEVIHTRRRVLQGPEKPIPKHCVEAKIVPIENVVNQMVVRPHEWPRERHWISSVNVHGP